MTKTQVDAEAHFPVLCFRGLLTRVFLPFRNASHTPVP